MTKQLSLAGLDPESSPTDRLFFGVFPDRVTAAQIKRLGAQQQERNGLRGHLLATDRFHVTLHHVGDYVGFPTDVANRAQAAAATVKAAPFEIGFDRVASFTGRDRNLPFVLRGGDGIGALMNFQRRLFEALKSVNLVRRTEPNFTPHVTLLYDDHVIAEQAVEPIRWIAREFILVHSLLGQTRHIPIARWPLAEN